jgi:hypothetical protein
VIRISPRSTPDAREGHEGQVLSSKPVLVVVFVVVVFDPGCVGARFVLGRRRRRRRLSLRHCRRDQERRLLQQRASRHPMALPHNWHANIGRGAFWFFGFT